MGILQGSGYNAHHDSSRYTRSPDAIFPGWPPGPSPLVGVSAHQIRRRCFAGASAGASYPRHCGWGGVNGGYEYATASDFHLHLAAGRPMLVLAGSGRFADDVAAALVADPQDIDPPLREAIQRYHLIGALRSLDIGLFPDHLRQQLTAYFKT